MIKRTIALGFVLAFSQACVSRKFNLREGSQVQNNGQPLKKNSVASKNLMYFSRVVDENDRPCDGRQFNATERSSGSSVEEKSACRVNLGCAGALLKNDRFKDKYVFATAAHCLNLFYRGGLDDKLALNEFSKGIVLRSHHDDSVLLPVSGIILHPTFVATRDFADIALFQVDLSSLGGTLPQSVIALDYLTNTRNLPLVTLDDVGILKTQMEKAAAENIMEQTSSIPLNQFDGNPVVLQAGPGASGVVYKDVTLPDGRVLKNEPFPNTPERGTSQYVNLRLGGVREELGLMVAFAPSSKPETRVGIGDSGSPTYFLDAKTIDANEDYSNRSDLKVIGIVKGGAGIALGQFAVMTLLPAFSSFLESGFSAASP